jgi:hypothetical protein
MKTEAKSEQPQADSGDRVELTVTQARGGVRRGMTKVLVISTLLAVASLGAIGIFASRTAPKPPKPYAIAAATQSDMLKGRTWDDAHLGANGLEKCNAFRRVVEHAAALQTAGGGTISSAVRMRLDTELAAAKEMPPAALRPGQCGVPL